MMEILADGGGFEVCVASFTVLSIIILYRDLFIVFSIYNMSLLFEVSSREGVFVALFLFAIFFRGGEWSNGVSKLPYGLKSLF
jgi:hypothetical protein